MNKKFTLVPILIILFIIIFATNSGIAQPPHGDNGPSEETGMITYSSDFTAVGETWTITESEEFDGKTIIDITFELTWTDDEGSNSNPDTFSLQVDDEEHDAKSNSGSGGSIILTWDEPELNNVWNIAVTCDSAGPTEEPYWRVGVFTQNVPDPGNSWTMVVTYTYINGTGSMGGMPANVRAVYSSPIFWIHVGLMISSTYLFLFTFIFAEIFLYSRNKWTHSESSFKRYVAKPNLTIILVVLAFLAFFLASVPIGMWVAGMMYGATKAWTGFPAMWNSEAWEFTNADNVSFVVLLLWAIPIYLNRAQIMRSKLFKKLFGWSKFAMQRVEIAPKPRLMMRELMLCYFFMGFLVYLVFMVQPHGSG